MQDEALAAKVARLGCATLVDAVGRVHRHRAHIPSMVSPDPSRPLFGPAATISFMPYREDLAKPGLDFGHFYRGALGGNPLSGQVLVLSSGGYPDVSHGGGTKLSRADGSGLAGILVDGRLRDFSQLRGYSFSTWCRGEAVRWGGDTITPHAFDVAVEVAGVCVNPGDYVYMDRAGGVVIPSASLHRVVGIAEEVAAEEAEAEKSIRDEAARPGG
ncbi:RraA family protein [Streptomyces sp. MC1]|uniref:RraA family protein n=1 Tax=unclassified Streptomyces TaxID=2593676 RepID=UPI0004CA5018|nr:MULTISPECIES: RraA family protein [unclassified Streptomyces]KOV98011.1 dimethylmenaquinone methyltransferase [Streptomyces sp. NRRL WC-3723]MBG7697574.1 RraA family protein [Streptomyces sp. MC1]